jgi:hypothetical protein
MVYHTVVMAEAKLMEQAMRPPLEQTDRASRIRQDLFHRLLSELGVVHDERG